MAIGMTASALGKVVSQAKRTRPKQNKSSAKVSKSKPTKPVNSSSEQAKAAASQNQYNYDVKSRATSRGAKVQSNPATGISSIGSVGGSPTPASTPPTSAQYSADLSAWKQNKRAMRGK